MAFIISTVPLTILPERHNDKTSPNPENPRSLSEMENQLRVHTTPPEPEAPQSARASFLIIGL